MLTRKICLIIGICITGFIVIMSSSGKAAYSQVTPTISSTPVLGERSLLADNPCSLPCWFGLTPGESTTEDAFRFIQREFTNGGASPESSVDSKTGYVINGWYRFFVGPYYRGDNKTGLDSFIGIKDGIIDYIKITFNRTVTLKQVVNLLGLPRDIYLSKDYMYMQFIYVTKLMRLAYDYPTTTLCKANNIGDNFWVDTITLYSLHSAFAPAGMPDSGSQINGYSNNQLQPELFAHSPFHQEYVIEPRDLNEWLNSDASTTCGKLWENLPEATAIPMPTVTPEQTLTPSK